MGVADVKRVGALMSLGRALAAPSEARHALLAQRMGSLHGVPQKIGQLLALGELERGDAVFAKLTEGNQALAPETAREALQAAFGQPLDTLFSTLSLDGISASLGQVHRGTLLDGTEVAVKLQYPGIADAVRMDLKALGFIGKVYRRGYDFRAYRETVGEMLRRELDYGLEAKALERFGQLTSGDSTFVTPRVVEHLCRPTVLTMTWLQGLTLRDVQSLALPLRESASRALVRWFLCSVLEWGLIHGDGHPGNIRFLPDGNGGLRLGMLDFGCVQALEGPAAGGLRLLVECVNAGEPDDPERWLARYEAMGFSRSLLDVIGNELGTLSKLLMSPLAQSGRFDPLKWELNEKMKQLLGERRFAFRFAAPSSFAFITRAFVGLIQTLKALAAPIEWKPLFDEIVARPTSFPSFALALPPSAVRKPIQPTLSQYLRIHIKRTGGARVNLTFDARSAENLTGLVPPEIMPRVIERGIDLQAIEQRAVDSQFAPGELFRLEESDRLVHVWLE